VFHLGAAAQKWAGRIQNPPSRLDKLGVKPGMKVRLIGAHDTDFRQELSQRGAALARSKTDLAFLAIREKDDLVARPLALPQDAYRDAAVAPFAG
jgi:hypothetical protein